MRRSGLLLLLVVLAVPTSVFAQEEPDDRWQKDPERDQYGRRYVAPPRNMFEITPFGSYRWGGTLDEDQLPFFGSDLDVQGSGSFGINFGIPIAGTPLKIELMVNHQDTHLSTGDELFEPDRRVADFEITQYHAGVMIPFGDPYNVMPFVVFSAGFANLDPQVEGLSAENRFSGSAGIGVKVPVSRNVAFRFETRGYFTSLGSGDDDDFDDCNYYCDDYWGNDLYQGEVSIGLSIGF